MTEVPQTIADAREQFLSLVERVRPELHRYCSRLTGSVIDGEDIVQDAFAKAFYALSQAPELPPLRPWLFRIAHNAALDFLKSHGRKYTEPEAEIETLAVFDDRGADPALLRWALARFLSLPLAQRSAVILKDVLGHSLEETAETMGTTVTAVKAALVRARANIASLARGDEVVRAEPERADLERYASRFNARDWEGLRALIADDCKLDLVSKSQRSGKQVGMYFDRYERAKLSLRVVRLERRLALAAFLEGAARPAYFILLAFEAGRVTRIRDYRYVPYIANEAEFELAT